MSFSSISSKSLETDDNHPHSNGKLMNEIVEKSDEPNDEPLDPRIQIELERANAATSEINNLETQLDEAQKLFQTSFTNCKQRLAVLAKKLGSCVERARPFFDACKQAEEAQSETQKAAQEYQRSVEIYRVAKEALSLAESKLLKADKREFDAAWQEYVNHATMKVMQAEQDKTRSERTHEEKSKLYQEYEQKRVALQRSLKRLITKSKPYFDAKEYAEYELQNQKLRIEAVQKAISQAKRMYRTALNNLERISEEIHLKRNNPLVIKLPPREPGVGSDKPDEFIEMPDLELTEFPKIDISDESTDDEDESRKSHDETLSNSISSVSIDRLSLSNKTSGMSNIQQTSDYESFADCMNRSPIIASANARIAIPLTNVNFDNRYSLQSSARVNGEGSSLPNDQQKRRKNGTSTTTEIRKHGKTTRIKTNNETPLLSNLFGAHKYDCDSNLNSNL
ncbi:unnamed protein product [Rotaria magnacalcarata]|uniref:SH3 domain-binding protein 5-like protein n=1 Tax=Rotaria magnacalcarata TaxID=392030 RepID=A0A816R763_9BILA|nr:unnamed protein product [Rotaria magnacalcarata]CAF2068614.1 unnamed protein product [Rotaria magnacalcarata]CAF2101354.1 unnamed protein product [Rotaria magnacalcarata]CAF3865085.1 unnamed protein product [Rotaria magnacalcarata]CAF4186128.1 unnamed protein product [Rotaria magnacalcarata]